MGTFLMLSSQANQSFQLMGKTKIGSKIGKMFGMGKGPSDVMSNAKTSTDVSNKMGKPKGSPLKTLSSGLKSMGNKKVLFGALNLIPTALGFVAMIPAIPGMIATSILGGLTGTALSALAVGIRGMGSKRALLGSLGLRCWCWFCCYDTRYTWYDRCGIIRRTRFSWIRIIISWINKFWNSRYESIIMGRNRSDCRSWIGIDTNGRCSCYCGTSNISIWRCITWERLPE